MVLADEALLPIALNSLPKKVNAVNITMGYPLKDIPTRSLFTAIFQLFLTQEKLQKVANQEFYYKDVIRILKHPLIYSLFTDKSNNNVDRFTNEIAERNTTFIPFQNLKKWLHESSEESKEVILNIFNLYTSTHDFFDRILQLIEFLKEKSNGLEKEYLFRFFTVFTQLKNLQKEFGCLEGIKIIQQFFQQLIAIENISFQGEPLHGLQIMGMLETRVLDFENVIITSVNENILPSNSTQSSFIPFDVKVEFGMPTYKEKDAIFSYHFFRLLQRAKNVYLLYNTDNDTFGGGEKSRFILQLKQLKDTIIESTISPKVITEKIALKSIKKTESVIETLKKLALTGISPSALTNYLYDPYQFYKQKVLSIYEYEEVNETVASNTMGTIVHDTLEALYLPYIGKEVFVNDLDSMQTKVDEHIQFYFKKHFNNATSLTGKNRLIYEVSKRFIVRFLEEERKTVANSSLKIIALEKKLTATITIEGFDFPINLKGFVDRIDELNGVTRILDYKTGMVTSSELKLADFSNIVDDKKYSKAIQVLLYAFLYQQNYPTNKTIETGIISFKNLKSGVLKMNFSSKRQDSDYDVTHERTADFMEAIKELIKEIFNPEIPFTEKINKKN